MNRRNHFLRILIAVMVLYVTQSVFGETTEAVKKRSDLQDSYLDALQKNHDEDSSNPRGDYNSYDNSVSTSYLPSYSSSGSSYGPPSSGSSYGPPTTGPSYGPPSYEYGPPVQPSYGYPPPTPSYYGPPMRPFYHYGPPPRPIVHSAPRDEHWLLDKFKFKLDLFTLGKLLIKLILFKKFIKFVALICLILFLPKLQSKSMMKVEEFFGDDDEDDDDTEEESNSNSNADADSHGAASHRAFASYYLPQRKQINEVTHFALTAIEAFTDKHLTKCGNLTDIPCRFQSMVDEIDTKYPYERIIEMYLPISKFFSSPTSTPQTTSEQSENNDNDRNIRTDASSEPAFIRTSTATTNLAILSDAGDDNATHAMHNSSNSNANDIH